VRIAVFPGSFDPFTLGHLDVVHRGLELFDQVVIAVAQNSAKTGLFDMDRRVALVKASLVDEPLADHVRVLPAPGLVVDLCKELGAVAIIKGLRGGADFDAEVPMALMNRHIAGTETVFIIGDPALNHISSSLVKDVARFGGNIDDLVAPPVAKALRSTL
jgi:pantetheine-phosphate adenylyltransferase